MLFRLIILFSFNKCPFSCSAETFKTDCTTAHRTFENMVLFCILSFGRRFISRGGDVDWPQRSCDGIQVDFFGRGRESIF